MYTGYVQAETKSHRPAVPFLTASSGWHAGVQEGPPAALCHHTWAQPVWGPRQDQPGPRQGASLLPGGTSCSCQPCHFGTGTGRARHPQQHLHAEACAPDEGRGTQDPDIELGSPPTPRKKPNPKLAARNSLLAGRRESSPGEGGGGVSGLTVPPRPEHLPRRNTPRRAPAACSGGSGPVRRRLPPAGGSPERPGVLCAVTGARPRRRGRGRGCVYGGGAPPPHTLPALRPARGDGAGPRAAVAEGAVRAAAFPR